MGNETFYGDGLINLSNPSINKVMYVCLYVRDTVFAA